MKHSSNKKEKSMLPQRKKIVVLCPGNQVTGGPELLHQLVNALIGLGRDAKICYYPTDQEFKCPTSYLKYEAPQVKASEAAGAIVILPEVATKLVRQFKNSDIAIWWLSVDNYFEFTKKSFARDVYKRAKSLYRGRVPLFRMKKFHHLAQSEYARVFLNSKGIKADMLTDYLNDAHMNLRDVQPREDVILYNPKKGIRYTRRLQLAMPEFKFVPLSNMTSNEISDWCNRAKVYIDFGHHPGKDRMPREAVIAGCCLITGRQGAANFEEDIFIPKTYKIDEYSARFELDSSEVINKIFENFDVTTLDFNAYRERIRREKSVFMHQVKNIFH